jgi:hypothetical protein
MPTLFEKKIKTLLGLRARGLTTKADPLPSDMELDDFAEDLYRSRALAQSLAALVSPFLIEARIYRGVDLAVDLAVRDAVEDKINNSRHSREGLSELESEHFLSRLAALEEKMESLGYHTRKEVSQ